MKNTIMKNNNLISKTRKPAIFYTHTHLTFKGEKNKINSTTAMSSSYVDIGREILTSELPRLFALQKFKEGECGYIILKKC